MNGKQLTIRGMVIGVIGSVVITCSSMYIALKLSSLPWPIMFVALFSMLALKALGSTNLNEINVTHTAMSAGAMVAGGLAFTIPGIWILNPEAEVSTGQLMAKMCIRDSSEAMGLSQERVLEIMEAASAVSNVASLDNQLVEEEYEAYFSQGSPENSIEKIMIKKELANLGKRERQVVMLRYYRDMTQQEIAGILGISQVQVSRIEKRAIAEIRKKLAE